MNRPDRAFTLIEVMASVLVLTFALTAACAMILYGLQLARSTHGMSLGMSTALAVFEDPSPMKTDPTFTSSGGTASGYLNGLWVERRESDETPLEGPLGTTVAVTVHVDVRDGADGTMYASITGRLIRRKP